MSFSIIVYYPPRIQKLQNHCYITKIPYKGKSSGLLFTEFSSESDNIDILSWVTELFTELLWFTFSAVYKRIVTSFS